MIVMSSTVIGTPADQRGDAEKISPDREEWILLSLGGGDANMPRMRRVARAILAGQPEIAEHVAKLHDHKGVLYVAWTRPPTQTDREFVVAMWQWVGNENPRAVEHFAPTWFEGAQIDKDLPW